MEPFKIRVDWTVHDAYDGEPAVVELHVMGKYPKEIHKATTPAEAVKWAVKWLRDRGFPDYWCNIDWHQRCDHKHLTLFPTRSPN